MGAKLSLNASLTIGKLCKVTPWTDLANLTKCVKRQRKGRDLNLTSLILQTILTNYKKAKNRRNATTSINRKPEKQMKIFPSFFTSYSSFIRKPVRLFHQIFS